MTTEELTVDAIAAGAVGLGAMAVIIGIVLLVATIKFTMSGMMPAAIICAFALITLFSPTAGFVAAIIALIVLALRGNPYLGAHAFLGWLLGLIIIVIAGLALVAMGMVVS